MERCRLRTFIDGAALDGEVEEDRRAVVAAAEGYLYVPAEHVRQLDQRLGVVQGLRLHEDLFSHHASSPLRHPGRTCACPRPDVALSKRVVVQDGGVAANQATQRWRQAKPARVFVALVCGLVGLGLVSPSAHAAFPGRNGRIAYEHERSAVSGFGRPNFESEILSVLPNGRRPRVLVPWNRERNQGSDPSSWRQAVDPAYSPDGRKLVFSSFNYGLGGELHLVRADGRGRVRRLTHPRPPREFTAGEIAPPPSPRTAAGWCTATTAARSASTAPEGAGPIAPSRAGWVQPAWSVRGRIAFSSPGRIYTVRPDGSRRRRVVAGSGP